MSLRARETLQLKIVLRSSPVCQKCSASPLSSRFLAKDGHDRKWIVCKSALHHVHVLGITQRYPFTAFIVVLARVHPSFPNDLLHQHHKTPILKGPEASIRRAACMRHVFWSQSKQGRQAIANELEAHMHIWFRMCKLYKEGHLK